MKNRKQKKQQKKYLMAILILVLMLVVGSFGMFESSTSSYSLFGKTFEPANGLFNITIPRGWVQSEVSGKSGMVAARTKDSNAFMQMGLDQYAYGPEVTLDVFVNSYITYIASKSDDPTQTQLLTIPEFLELDGMTGYYYEFSTVSDGIKLHMFSYAVKLDEGFLTIDVAVNDAVTSDYEKVAKSIIKSVKVNSEQSARDVGASAVDQKLVADDTQQESAVAEGTTEG